MNNDVSQSLQDSSEASPGGAVRKLQLLRAGSVEFAIVADEIAAIVDWREPTPLPHAPKSVLGVVSIQARMLTVFDLATLLGTESPSSGGSSQHIIALRGDEQLALAVEGLGELIEVADDVFAATREDAGTLVSGVLNHGGEINILNVKELFSSAIQGRERRRRRF